MENKEKFLKIALVLIGGSLIIYGLYTHPERLLPRQVENTKPLTLN